jgi:hypothetical protein
MPEHSIKYGMTASKFFPINNSLTYHPEELAASRTVLSGDRQQIPPKLSVLPGNVISPY